MRLLLNLITSLSDEEAAKLSALNLRGKQSSVMDLVFAARANGKEPTHEEIAALQLSDSHLYEISSVVLSKCHHLLVPEMGAPLLEFLTYKNVHLQFKQELRRQKKQFANKKGKEAEEFYLAGFELLHRFSYNLIDWDLIEEFGKYYLTAKQNASEEDALAVKARTLLTKQVSILTNARNFRKEQETIFAELSEFERVAKLSSHPYLCYCVYSGLAWYWHNLGENREKSLAYIQRALPYSVQLKGYVFRNLPLEMQLRLADAQFILGMSEQALEIFDKTFQAIPQNHLLWRRNYFLFRYVEVLIYNGKYVRAELILKERFEPLLKLRPTTTSATAATLFAVLYLFTGDYPKAKQYLDIGLELNSKKNFTLYNEVRNRYIEAIYYYLIGDWDFTQTVTHRALQYLRGKHIGLNKHVFGYNFKIIDATIEYYSQGTPFWHKFEDKYKVLTSPAESLFGKLLQKVRSTPRDKTRTVSKSKQLA